jgi:hypothetical protein
MLVALATLLLPASGFAQDDAKLRALFNAGAQAYERGKFLAAAQTFEEAYKVSPKPALLFSAAQAYRRQFVVDESQQSLRKAIDLYRRYLTTSEEGKRRLDAVKALEELEAKLEDADGGSAPAAPPAKPITRLVVSTDVSGATVRLDGGPVQPMPLIQEVKPGEHELLVEARGYQSVSREVVALEGVSVPLPITLEPEPATVALQGGAGADLYVDGELRGELPLAEPLELPAGTHALAVLARGHEPFSTEVSLERGQDRSIEVQLTSTRLRTASFVVMGAGAAGLVAGAILGGVALAREAEAKNIRDARVAGDRRTEQDRVAYNDAISQRDDLRLASAITLGTGGGVAVAGLLLFLLDEPALPSAQPRDEQNEPQPKSAPSLDLSLGPTSLVLRGSF